MARYDDDAYREVFPEKKVEPEVKIETPIETFMPSAKPEPQAKEEPVEPVVENVSLTKPDEEKGE